MILLYLNPYHAEFLKWNISTTIFGTVHYQFYGNQDENFQVGRSTVLSLVRQGWPGSVLVANVNHFWFQQDKG